MALQRRLLPLGLFAEGAMRQDRPVLVWFRRDLRLADNPALYAAFQKRAPVVPVYVLDEAPQVRRLGGALNWWLDKSLRVLEGELRGLGSRLILRRGDAIEIITGLVSETHAQEVLFNRVADPQESDRDELVNAKLRAEGIHVQSFNASFLLEPGSLKNVSGAAYKVFAPFWRAARGHIAHKEPLPRPSALTAPAHWPKSDSLASWGLHPRHPDWSTGFSLWRPGEEGADARLARFVDEGIRSYAANRDRPNDEGSSRLSPHLRWGEIGPGQVWRAIVRAQVSYIDAEAQAEKFFAELGWREFNAQLLLANRNLARESIKQNFDRFPWRRDQKDLTVWRRGLTGYPMVDAGMRELWSTGWMHNRVRLIAASFLVKHLLIDWREGEAWFWDTLVDADPANNPANWQWIAGTGADSAPFFRIFNPVTQGQRFDPDGGYVRRWVPELARLSNRWVHDPWSAPPDELLNAGVRLGRDYPRPMVDHATARRRAMEALNSMRGST